MSVLLVIENDRLQAEAKALQAEIDRLRAENAELRHLFDILLNDQTAWYRKARELLAKTAKEGEPTAAASDPKSQTRE